VGTYYYAVTAVNSALSAPGNASPASSEASAAVTVVKLTGTPIGTTTSWANNGDTIAQVFDGNLNTFYDAADGTLTQWVGLDLGSPQTISQIQFAPRSGDEFRMLNGKFQVSSTPDFSSNVVTLYTVTTIPTSGVMTTVPVNPGGAYRYIRYCGGTQWVNIAEMEVDGVYTPPPAYTKLTGTPIGTAGSYGNWGNTIDKVFDGSFTSFFDPPDGSMTDWAGLDLGGPQTITQIKFAPRAGYESRMIGGQFQVSSTADFSSNVITLYTIVAAPVAGQFTTVNVSPGGNYRYVRYVGGSQYVNIAEMEVDGIYIAPPAMTKLTGVPIGTAGSYANAGNTIANVFDGNLTTFFDPPDGTMTDWAGLDLGGPQTIEQIKYAPRAGYENRMIGGQFQVSNAADFSSGVVTLYTITTAPVAGQFTTVFVNPGGNYRYVRCVGGSQYVNIAEMEVDGVYTPPPAPVQLTGTVIGTPTSWSNNGDTIAQVFDGKLNTYFDAPDGNLTDWAGLDLGAPHNISSIEFAPRPGYEWRMLGGQFQVSNSANFSSGVVTLFTITTVPTSGQLTSIAVSAPGYEYIRYVGGTSWVNIAEMEVFGN
jgi:hypothetical protein